MKEFISVIICFWFCSLSSLLRWFVMCVVFSIMLCMLVSACSSMDVCSFICVIFFLDSGNGLLFLFFLLFN